MRLRGAEHERAYIATLRATHPHTTDLRHTKDPAATLAAMRAGADAIVQAPLGSPTFFGIADVLLRTDTPSALGAHSYEPVDTKLAAETKAGALLQLLTYCELLGSMQNVIPARFFVVTPLSTETYRTADYAAYFRLIRDHLHKVQPGTWVTLLTGHMGDTLRYQVDGGSPESRGARGPAIDLRDLKETNYRELAGRKLRLPSQVTDRPDLGALDWHHRKNRS